MNFLTVMGLIGNFGFGFAAVTVAYDAWKDKGTDVPWKTIWLFLAANIGFFVYLLGTFGWHWLTGVLGIVESVSWAIVACMKARENDGMSVGDPQWHPKYFASNGGGYGKLFCQANDFHEGPCNGLPRHTCPGYGAWSAVNPPLDQPLHDSHRAFYNDTFVSDDEAFSGGHGDAFDVVCPQPGEQRGRRD